MVESAVDGVTANRIAMWDGNEWAALGGGAEGDVNALAWDATHQRLYAGGDFIMIGGTSANYIAQWDGSAWAPLAGGMNGPVRALAWDAANQRLYAGGDFTTAGGVPANRIARWSDGGWTALGALGGGVSGDVGATVLALAWDAANQRLYAGGMFSTAGGYQANHVAQWSGMGWSRLGNGMNGEVYALAWDTVNQRLYAGGNFNRAGVTVGHIAQWNGSAWSALGSGMNTPVNALAWDATNQRLYAGGAFSTGNHRIAQWNGNAWSAPGRGMNGPVRALAWDAANQRLYVGGEFTTVGDKTARVAMAQMRISQAPLFVTATPSTIGYGQDSELEISGGSGTGVESFAITAGAGFCALSGNTVTGIDLGLGQGGCTITATKAAAGIYGKATATVDITVIEATGTVVFDGLSFTYDGNAKAITAHIAEEPGTTCTVPQSPIGPDAGDYPVTATCAGTGYTATGSATASIARATGSVSFGNRSFPYDGNVKVISAHIAEEPGTICTVPQSPIGPNAGSYTVTAVCEGSNYIATGSATASIAKATGSVSFDNLSFPYDGSAKAIAAHIVEEPGTTCAVPQSPIGPNAGNYVVTAVCEGSNYTAIGSATANIAKAAGSVFFDALSFTYDGSTKPVTARITEEPTTVCAVSESPIGPGTGDYPVTASCDGTNYTATGNATASITKAVGTVAFEELSFTYDGSTKLVTAHIDEEPATACTVPESLIGPDAGDYPVTATCDGTNYTATGSATANIAKAAGSVSFDELSFTYDGSTKPVTAHITEEPATTCTVLESPIGPDAGDYLVTASCDGTNYTATGDATANIAKAAGTVAFDDLSFTYDGNSRSMTAHIAEEPATTCAVPESPIGPDAGEYPVTATCDGTNYTAMGDATANIGKAVGTIAFDELSFTYDGNSRSVTAHITEEPSTTCTVLESPIGPDAGDYPVTASCDGTNYTATGDATANIAKAAGTVVFDDLSFTYDGNSRSVTAHIAEEPSTTCTVPESPIGPDAGDYPVTASCDGTNYTATGNATANIAKAVGTVAFDELLFTYDGNSKVVTAHIAEEPATTCTVPESPIGPDAGDYAVTATCDGANYTATGDAAADIAQISQDSLIVIADSPILFGETSALSASGGSGTGAVSYAVTDGAAFCEVSGDELTGTGLGTCTVTATKAADTNYLVATATADVTVTPKADLEIAKDASRATAMDGDALVFSIVVPNIGPNDVTGASVIDNPPATLVDVEWACVPPPVSSVPCPAAPHDAGTGAMSVLVDLPAGEYLRYDLSGRVQGVIGAEIENTASVTAPSGVTDPDGGDNSSTASVLIVPEGVFADGFEAEQGALTVPAAERARVRR